MHLLIWAWNRYRPSEGWLSLFSLAAAVVCLVLAVLDVAWVPEVGVVVPTAALGLIMGVGLAKRPLSARAAWTLITLYGLLLTTVWLARLLPPVRLLFDGWWPTTQYLYQNGALFLDRAASWFKAVFAGETSQETIVFAFGLGLLAWLLAAYAGWSTFRHGRPMQGLTLMAAGLALNGYFGQAPAWSSALFAGLMALTAAVVHYANLEQGWEQKGIDYSEEIRLELLAYTGAIALVLWAFAFLLPDFSIREMARLVRSQPAVQEAEETLERVFAGVRQPDREEPGVGAGPGAGRGGGVLPRSHLLGNAPELRETVVMTATVTLPQAVPANSFLTAVHWRGLSYDVYTGRGWRLSEEREERMAANAPLPLPPVQEQVRLSQSVSWVIDQRLTRYTLGLPLVFDHETATFWRGLEDLVRARGDERQYQATAQAAIVTEAALRETAVSDVPPVIIARYTPLPETVPARVYQLAQEVAGDLPTAYDQARALERFLHQYPYSLEIELAPPGTDPVDYFLFEQQEGYCDYYASAMVVMARTLGLPARLAAGFLAQPPDENGVQTIYQINAHSWAEVYFAGYGWVEFEPTTPFAAPREPTAPVDANVPEFAPAAPPPPLPEPPPPRPFPWALVGFGGLLVAASVAWWLWQRHQKEMAGRDGVLWAFGRLQHHAQKLGQPVLPSQTPYEFTAALLAYLNRFQKQPRLSTLVDAMRSPIERLTSLFVQRRYSKRPDDKLKTGSVAASEAWHRLRRPLWLLRIVKWLWREERL